MVQATGFTGVRANKIAILQKDAASAIGNLLRIGILRVKAGGSLHAQGINMNNVTAGASCNLL